MPPPDPPRIRSLDPAAPRADQEVELVATRMGLTLVEVLGEERGGSMYDAAWLRARVRWHLDPSEGRRAAVLLAEDRDGTILGHTIVRVEDEVGLFSTTYVDPAARRDGVAQALVRAGEDWLRAAGMVRALTYTDAQNGRLIGLFRSCGYDITLRQQEWVGLSRRL